MSRRSLAVLLLTLLLASPALAQKAGPGEKEIARDGPFVIYSDVELSTDRATQLLERVKKAYDFVGDEQRWAKDASLTHELAVRVVSDARMKEIAPKAKGVSQGKHTIVMTASFLEEERSSRTLAHELTHVQDRRHVETKNAKLPHWLTEGRAVAMGRDYEAKLQIADKKYDDNIAKVASTVTVTEAKRILEEEAYVSEKKMKSVFRMEALGFFFIEWVRGYAKIEDLEPRLAKIIASVGNGGQLEEAFKAELKVGLAELEKAFYEHLEKTQGSARRMDGTVFGARAN